MNSSNGTRLPEILQNYENEIVSDWQVELTRAGGRNATFREAGVREQCTELLRLIAQASQSEHPTDVMAPEWSRVRELLSQISRSRGQQGVLPSDTAMFIFSLKRPLFTRLREVLADDARALFDEIWAVTQLLDRLGLFTTEVHQKTREEVIARQQEEMLELSTPVVKLWDGILALPMIGTLDSSRTQVVMEALLQKLVETSSQVAIIDITGVPTVDTLVAQHLLKTVAAARLMGADCIISGIRPQIAQTIVHLGVDLGNVVTKSSLSDAFALALRQSGLTVNRSQRA